MENVSAFIPPISQVHSGSSPTILADASALLSLPRLVQQRGEALLDQQMWCWGWDIRRDEGNLLLAYGGEKRPAQQPRQPSAYSWVVCVPEGGEAAVLTLWGWGLWVAAPGIGSVFVNRSCFRLRFTDQAELLPQAWREADLPTFTLPTPPQAVWGLHSMADVCVSIATYERWVMAQLGSDYRARVVAGWPQAKRFRGGVAAMEMAAAWAQLAADIRSRIG